MDDIVRQAIAKWPNVPNCFGWLGLDARGNWYLRDDAAQHAGSFGSNNKGAKGSLLCHAKLIEFIQRNYEADASGKWYFQNGPQRVYVELEATPWIWRIGTDGAVRSHAGHEVAVTRCVMDQHGWLYLQTSLGFGLVHTQDVAYAADAIEQGRWRVENEDRESLSTRYAYVLSPQATNQQT